MPVSTELSVAQLRQEARESIGQALEEGIAAGSALLLAERTFQDALRNDEQRKLHDAFYKYQQGASLFSYAINLPEVKQASKSSEIHKKVASLQTQLSSDYLPRSSRVETLLKQSEASQNQQRNDAMPNDSQLLATDPKPGASIADRMRSLQGAGMVVSVPKRLSRDIHGVDSGEPPRRTENTNTCISSQHDDALSGDINSRTSPPSRRRTPANVTPGPPQDISNESRFTLSADEFSITYPSIDELDARDDWKSSPAPNAHSLHNSKLPDLPARSTISPPALAEWVETGYKILVLDVRTREKFENERLPLDAVVCIEPSILMRSSLSSQQLENALVISPQNEQVIFGNRDKFDVIILMDEDSSTVPPAPSPLSALIHTVYETEFKKSLKLPPVLLSGGLKSWKHDIGTTTTGHGGTPAEAHAQVNVRSESGIFPEDLPHPIDSAPILTPPPVSFSNSSGGRRRNDFVERWQPALIAQIPRPGAIDYPVLPSHILPQPPAAVSSGSDRQERRSISLQPPQPFSKLAAKLSPLLIPSNYPVTTWDDVEIGISGLKNLGNTCYMNSTLQCLSATVPFVRFFQDGRWKTAVNMMNPLGSKGHVAQHFATIISEMRRQEYSYLSPLTFRKGFCLRAPQFEGSNQHDAQEFLSSLLDGLHEDLNRVLQKPPPLVITLEREAELEKLPPHVASSQEWTSYKLRNDSLVVDYFQGQFRNRLQCTTCQHTSTTYNAFMYLSLPLPSRNSKGSLYQCLDAFVSEEIMDRGNAWRCPRCQVLRRATKQLSLSRLPPVLLIQLKRFSVNGPFTDKLETSIDYPVRGLDLTRYVPSLFPGDALEGDLPRGDPRRQEPPYIYDLYAVTNHFGTLSTGHYTAYVASKGHWVLCDDSRVSTIAERDIVGRPAYILYYKRRGSNIR